MKALLLEYLNGNGTYIVGNTSAIKNVYHVLKACLSKSDSALRRIYSHQQNLASLSLFAAPGLGSRLELNMSL